MAPGGLFQSMAEACSTSAGPSPLACLPGPLPAAHTHSGCPPSLSFLTQQHKHRPASETSVKSVSLAPSESAHCRLPLSCLHFLPFHLAFPDPRSSPRLRLTVQWPPDFLAADPQSFSPGLSLLQKVQPPAQIPSVSPSTVYEMLSTWAGISTACVLSWILFLHLPLVRVSGKREERNCSPVSIMLP